MKSLGSNRFQRAKTRPRWEGIIFTGVDQDDQRISISEAKPVDHLKPYIESIWFMRWILPSGEGMGCIVAPNPCAKLVVLQQNEITHRPILVAAKKNADLFELQGSGATVGFDFKPGGLFAILGRSLKSSPKDAADAIEFCKGLPSIPNEIWTEDVLTNWLNSVDRSLTEHLRIPKRNNYGKIVHMVERALAGSFQTPVEMAHDAGISVRSLQRIFQDEVGVSPRDLLRIARFNEAIRNISQNDFKSFADAALASGFFDQPHMANEFRKLVSSPPSRFRRYL